MKKRIYIIVIILLIYFSINIICTSIDIPYSKKFNGIKFRLGEENEDYFEKVSVIFNGTIVRSPGEFNKYIGDIIIDDIEFLDTELNGDYVSIIYTNDGEEKNAYGVIRFNWNYSKISVEIFESVEETPGSLGWTNQGGLVISAPASTREEAYNIYSDL